MTEPTATQTLRALVARQGASRLAIAFVAYYWKPLLATLSATLALGTIIQQGRDAQKKLADIETAQHEQSALITSVDNRLTKVEGEWGALFGAAHINVIPNKAVADEPRREPAKLYGGQRRPLTSEASASSAPTERPKK